MVSRQETARPLLTPGEVMLPPADELLLVSGIHPILAKKARYYEDCRLSERILSPPVLGQHIGKGIDMTADDWRALPLPVDGAERRAESRQAIDVDPANAGIRREPELPEHEEIAPRDRPADREFDVLEDESDLDVTKARTLRRGLRIVARQAAMDPDDGIGL
jgi:type IV secretion system protein VirD4